MKKNKKIRRNGKVRTTSCTKHSETCAAPHCMVLPIEEFSGIIPQPLTVYSTNFLTKQLNRFRAMLLSYKKF